MALLAAPLSAPAEEPWLRAVAGCGLDFALLRAAESSGGGLDRGLEELLRACDLPRTVWLAQLSGPREDLGYALEVIGTAGSAMAGAAGAVTVAVGHGVGGASAAVVDSCGGGAGHRVVLVQVGDAQGDAVHAALREGNLPGALRLCRLALLRDAGAAWAVLATAAGAERVVQRVAAPDAPARLPVAAPPQRTSPSHSHPLRQRGERLGAAAASLLVVAVVAGGAGWAATHRAASRLAASAPPHATASAAIPEARVHTMAATWDRTAEVVLFGGATPAGAGHGLPLDDTWRGSLPPAAPWHRMASADVQPSPRLGGAMAADVADGYVLLYGGEAAGGVGLGDTWTYAGDWALATPQAAPPAGPALAATEPSTGRVLLVTTCCALGPVPTAERMQTWRWTGSDWTELGGAPGWVTTAALVADPWDDSVVMVADGGNGHAATYLWNGSAWSASASGGPAPPVMAGTHPALAYDPSSHAVLDVVGAATWVFTPAQGWRQQDAAGGPAVVGLVVPDPVDGRAMLYGGPQRSDALSQRWFWFGGAWTESLRPPLAAQPAAGFGAAVAADPAGGGLVLFGGSQAMEQTWVWSGTSWWDAFFTAPIPAPRLGASMAYDPQSGTALLVGGRLAGGGMAQDIWAWRGGEWTRLDVRGVPPPTVEAPMAWDEVHHQAVLLVADSSAALPTAQTWVWDGAAWSLRHPTASPPLRPESSMAFDPATQEVMLTVPCCPVTLDQRTETWTWDGTTWARRDTLHQPPIHASITADPARGRTLLVAACCGGFDPVSSIGPPQTWSWDGRDWAPLAAPLPALQDVAALATDARGHPLLIGRVAGAGPRHPLDGVWTWTGAAWTRLL